MSELTRKKNESSEIMFAMVDSTTPANLKSGLTVTDDPYYRDGAGAWTALSIADAATEIGSTGMYTIEMTAAELNHDLILIKLTSTGAADTIVVVRTTTHDIDDVNIVVPDAAGVAPTAAEIKTEIEQAGSSIASILEDTGDLQTNQGAWATATGFSTHNAADVKTAIEAAGSHLALILADTGELQTNQGNWLTATGFSTHNAAAVWSVATRILTASTNFNDLTVAEVKAEAVAALADIKLDHLINTAVDTNWATTVHINSVIGHLADVGTSATFDRTTDALEALRIRGDSAWATATGFNTVVPDAAGTAAGLHTTTDDKIDVVDGNVDAILVDTGTTLETHMTDIKGTGFVKDTHSLPQCLTATGFSVPNEYDTVIASLQTDLDNPSQYKATGFSTHNAADIWTVGTRALTDKSGFALLSTGADLILKDSIFAIAMADATWDELLTGVTHNIPTSAGRKLREASDAMVLRSEETAQSGSIGSITLAAAASAIDHFYDKATIIITGGTGVGQARTIDEYVGSTKFATICENWVTAPDNTSTYVIRGHTCVSVFTINPDALAQINTECDTALTDYDPPTRAEATSDKSAIITEVDANETKIDTIDGIVDTILVDTGTTLENHLTDIKGTGFVKDTDSLPQCLTAIGFSAPNEYDTAIATLQTDLDNPAQYKADVSALATTTALSTAQADIDTITGSDGVVLATQQLNYAPNTVIPDAMGTAAGLHTTTDGKVDALQTDTTTIKAKTDNLPSGMAKNVAVPKFDIFMVLSSDHVTGATGKTVTGTISKDGGAFVALTNPITEVDAGMYTIASGLTQAERNADVSTLKFSADGCDDRIITIISS